MRRDRPKGETMLCNSCGPPMSKQNYDSFYSIYICRTAGCPDRGTEHLELKREPRSLDAINLTEELRVTSPLERER